MSLQDKGPKEDEDPDLSGSLEEADVQNKEDLGPLW